MAKEKALALDAQDLPLEAAQAYEEAIAASDADVETFINLAVLYFVCVDGGYAPHHHLSHSPHHSGKSGSATACLRKILRRKRDGAPGRRSLNRVDSSSFKILPGWFGTP